MFFYEGQTCPVCGRHFGEQDDIVTCPECGAPHHRACWKSEGHCHFENLHGTDKQWHQQQAPQSAESGAAATPKKRCRRCGYDNPEFAEFCAHCGLDLGAEEWQSTPTPPPYERPPVGQYTPPHTGGYAPFAQTPLQDPYGGVPRTETIEGVPVDTIAQLLGPNSAYYLPRFFRMSRGGSKISWNWAAFLLPYNWLLYRKNILLGSLSFVLLSTLSLFSASLLSQLETALGVSTYNVMAFAEKLLTSQQGLLMFSIISLLSFLVLAGRIAVGMFGNYLYMLNILRKAKVLDGASPSPYDQGFRKTGGVSFALAFVPELITVFVQYVIIILSL